MPPAPHLKPLQTPIDPLGLTSEDFVRACREQGVFRPAALAAYRAVFRQGTLESGIAHAALPPITKTLREDSPEGQVVKFLTQVEGTPALKPASPPPHLPTSTTPPLPHSSTPPLEVESVLIPMIGSLGLSTYTLCVSSQVGCAMGCGFCETAQMGLIRSLTPAEIVSQWYNARHVVGIAPKNIVFMGMGEPMHNYDAVMQAVAVLKDHNGPHVPISQITISTVGNVDGLRKMAEQIKQEGWHRLNIALSLNAPNDEVRAQIMPINKSWNMADLQQVLLDWPRFAGNKLCIEYVLIPGVNDRPEHVEQLAAWLLPFKTADRGKPRALLNLIPYNPRRNSPWPAPTEEHVEQFLQALINAGIFAKRRRTKGRQMMGACGQLGAAHIRARKLVTPITPTISAESAAAGTPHA
ncbi:MAG TPA: 23S rRNA (adenine(2503)-C(2))-methyltransferase RlmN [Phycisphaerales bacterium]|nr:23S rRNA (adenine(2503)-C(2))-methyltransferase RlmN [Phycisphaerales bacterium]